MLLSNKIVINKIVKSNIMDDTLNSQMFAFDSPIDQSSYIKVIGVGGGGNNAVNHMFRKGITGVDFIVSNTDMKALNSSPVPNKLVLGHDGMGAGGRPEKARQSAEEKADEIRELFSHNTKMVFITAGMGGGTGTGAAPIIAKYAKEITLDTYDDTDPDRILVVAVVTTPFLFEGNRRRNQAQAGVEELRKYVDAILIINNEKLRSYGNLVMTDAFAIANDVLLTAVKGIAEIITINAYVNIDFRDVNTVMEGSGTALMGIGEGQGEERAQKAVEEAATSVLLDDNNIHGAKNVLLYFSYAPEHEITMDEMSCVTDYITRCTGSPDTNIIWGSGTDDTLGEKLKITLIATGFAKSKPQETTVIPLTELKNITKPIFQPNPTEPRIVHKSENVAATLLTPEPAISTPANEPQDTMAKGSTPERHVFYLDDEEPKTDNNPQPIPLNNDGIQLLHRDDNASDLDTPIQSAPTNTHPKASEVPPMSLPHEVSPNQLDFEAQSRAERIKAMHNLLRNTVDGYQQIEAIDPLKLCGEAIDLQPQSSMSEVAKNAMDSEGRIIENPYLYKNPD